MSTRLVTHISCSGPVCGPEITLPNDVVICIPFEKTQDQSGFLQGQLVAQSQTICDRFSQWTYIFQYDDEDLIPNYQVVSADISGAVCKDCLVRYLESLVS